MLRRCNGNPGIYELSTQPGPIAIALFLVASLTNAAVNFQGSINLGCIRGALLLRRDLVAQMKKTFSIALSLGAVLLMTTMVSAPALAGGGFGVRAQSTKF